MMAGFRSRLCLAALLSGLSSAALAQTQAAQAGDAGAQNAAQAGQTPSGGVEEIIVTAERRNANLQSVPIAVTAVTQSAIEAQGIRTINDLASFVPNLTTTTGPQGSADANFFVRGVGQFDFIATNDPGVGVYVDGVYLGRTVGALLDSGDIGRVEVLRGPQGTLFGRNTLGGAVSVTSVQPTIGDQLNGRVRLTGGSRNRFEADGGINAPLGETAAARIYGFYRTQDGFAYNPVSGTRFGATDRWGVKGQFVWKPASNLTINLAADYTLDKSNPAPSVLVGIVPLPFFPPAAFGQVQDRNQFYRTFASNSPKSRNEIWGVSGTVTYDWGPRQIKSITAYRELDAFSTSDPDGTLFRIYDQQSPTRQHQFSQEIQLSGKAFGNRFEYLLGGYYFNERVRQTLFLCFAPITPVPTAPFNSCNTWNQGNDQETNSYAVFGQARVYLTPELSLTLGGRYTSEDKTDTSKQAFDTRPAGLSPFGAAAFPFGLPAGARVLIPLFPSPFIPGTVNPGRVSFDRFTPKLGLEYKVQNLLIFGSYAEGFRSGGFNGRLIAPQPTIPTYRPDTTQSGEIGFKSDLLDRRVRLNVTGFYTKYKGIQQTISDPAVQFRVANAGDAELYGVEAETTIVPVERLRINGSFGYTHSAFQNVPALVGPINGNKLPFAPEFTIAVGAEYGIPLGGWKLTPRVDYRYQSRTYFTAFNNRFQIPGTTTFAPDDGIGEQQAPLSLVSLRVTLIAPGDRYSIAGFVDNLTDEKYYTFGQNALFAQGVSYNYLGRPREFGVTASAKF
jgi:iron complex outermembrane receptor protein